MILFETKHQDLYNYVIHNFLKLQIFNDETDIGDMIEILLPKYLYREQYKKCVKTFEDIYYWTQDKFYHRMKVFHELVLYKFIDYMADLRADNEDFDNIYFDKTSRIFINEASKIDHKECRDFSIKEYEKGYFDLYFYSDSLFTDTDFLIIETLYNNHQFGNTLLEEHLGINIDFYYDILPLDIQEKYKTNHITLAGEIHELLEYIQVKIEHGSLYKLFWEQNLPIKEERIQIILENMMDAYFKNEKIDISREVLLGSGQVDFKLYKNSKEEEKILIEVKLASSSYLKKGYEKQLVEYMLSTKYKNAFYLIACFTDSEYNKTVNFIRNRIYTDTVQLFINIFILDLRQRKTASKI